MRATLLLLLLANLAFLAWATFVDVVPEPPPSDSISQLPRLQLLSEVKARQPAANHASAPASSTPAAVNGAATPTNASTTANGPASSAAGGPSASAAPGSVASSDPPASAATVPPAATTAGTATAATVPAAMAAAPTATAAVDRCVTIGPFSDPQRASAASALLQERGFTPRPRDAATQRHGYWVYIDGLESQSAESGTIRRLERNGIVDAKIMPNSGEKGRRVSVGLFTRRDDAERRARAVRGLGLDVQIEEQHPTRAGHWVDVNLASSTQSLPTESLLSLQDDGSRLEIAECPSAAQPSAAEDQSSEPGSTSEKPSRVAVPPASASRPAISRALSAQRPSQPG